MVDQVEARFSKWFVTCFQIYNIGFRENQAEKSRNLFHFNICSTIFNFYIFIYFLTKNSEIKEKFEYFLNEITTRFGENIKELYLIGGKEYDNKKSIHLLKKVIRGRSLHYRTLQNAIYLPKNCGLFDTECLVSKQKRKKQKNKIFL